MRLIGTVAFLICSMTITTPPFHGQSESRVATLFEELKSPGGTDQAAEELLKLARSDPNARAYLADHLPALVDAGPKDSRRPWENAVRLAGDLQIAEVAPALARWIGLSTGGTVTLAQEARLEYNPAAKALAQIGEPAISALSGVLSRGNLGERKVAVYALKMIGSSRSRTVLRQHLRREPDSALRSIIEKSLDGG